MKISLEHVDTRALRVDLPGAGNEAIAIRAAHALKGTIEQSGERLTVSGFSAERLDLEALRVVLDELVLASESGATLAALRLALEQVGARLALDATAASLDAVDLSVTVADVHVSGRWKLAAPRLSVRDDEGSLASERVELSGFVLRIGDVELTAETVLGVTVQIAWGKTFRLAAASLEAPSLRFAAPQARVAATGVALRTLVLGETGTTIAHASVQGAELALTFPQAAESPAAPATAAAVEPRFDWKVLDRLSGQLDLDAAVDLTVPIIGRRQATHRPRITIENGAIDYRALEKNLARLEDALLDFSVRDGGLVLERVNPLFPARGHGKPVVIWALDPADLPLAENDRVRLAVLPSARVAGDGEEDEREPSRGSSIALRALELRDINARLALAPLAAGDVAVSGQLRPRHLGSLTLAGNVFHDAEGPARPGTVRGELTELSATVEGLTLGTSRLDVASLTLAAASSIDVIFAGVTPIEVRAVVAGLVLEGVAQVAPTLR